MKQPANISPQNESRSIADSLATHSSSTQKKAPAVSPFVFQKKEDVVQLAITEEVTIPVPGIKQKNSNSCWAATGWSIHTFKGGTYATEADFVKGQGSATAQSNYSKNKVTDIDAIIGSQSNTNYLAASDVEDPFSKSAISRAINKKQPILANVNNNHYIIICGKHKDNGEFKLQIMDPATGGKTWESLNSGPMVSTVGTYTLSVLYYL